MFLKSKSLNVNLTIKTLIYIFIVMMLLNVSAFSADLPGKIIVGCLEPLTGAHAVFGIEGKVGMEFAVKHINEAGGIKSLGGIPLELVIEDVGEDAMSARLATESIISKHSPVAV